MAKCEGYLDHGVVWLSWHAVHNFSPSTNWAQGGPIIEREKISVRPALVCGSEWMALGANMRSSLTQFGPTPLIAAMRCYVASKLGDEVDVPAGLPA